MTRRTTSGLAVLGVLLVATSAARAQTGNLGLVVRDGSIGPAIPPGKSGVVQPGGPPADVASYLIAPSLGELSADESNLFHSFQYFSIGPTETARFTGPDSLDNIISRVTGGVRSDIMGKLESTAPYADLYLLNPYGVVFGKGSEVSVDGSFYVSTADKLLFDEGEPLLTGETTRPDSFSSAAPAEFGFLYDEPGGIELDFLVDGRPGFDFLEGETFSAVGGPVTVRGREDNNAALNAPGGRLQLVSVAKSGVRVPVDATPLDVGAFAPGSFGAVRLENSAVLQVNGERSLASGSGRIVIRGGWFVMEGGALNARALNAADGASRAVDVAVTDAVELGASAARSARILSFMSSAGGGAAGDVRLSGASVTLRDGARIETQTNNPKVGPSIVVDANAITVSGVSPINAQTTQLVTRSRGADAGSAGSISISGRAAGSADRAQHVLVDGGAQIVTEADNTGQGAAIEIRAETVDTATGGEVVAISQADNSGNLIHIDAGTVSVTSGSSIKSDHRGSKTGAAIEITADRLDVTNDGAVTSVANDAASGDGGDVAVTAPTVNVTGGGQITSENRGVGTGGAVEIIADTGLHVANEGQVTTRTISTASTGQRRAGDLTIHAGDVTVEAGEGAVDGSQIGAITSAEGAPGTDQGKGGDLALDANSVQLLEGGQVRTTTDGSAPAGALTLVAHNNLLIRGAVNDGDLPSGLFSGSGSQPNPAVTGSGGDLSVTAPVVELQNGGEISASTLGPGGSGDVTITAVERVSIRGDRAGDRSVVAAQGAGGPGGDLSIATDVLELLDGGEVTATTTGAGNSGDVTIAARTVLVQGENRETESGIFAATVSGLTEAGEAGSITLTVTESLRVTDRARIAVATRGAGFAGDILMNGGGSIEISNGAEVTADAFGNATSSDINVVSAERLTVTSGGTITAETLGLGFGGVVDVGATNIEVSDGGTLTARSRSPAGNAGDAGRITVQAEEVLRVQRGIITTEALEARGGDITLVGGNAIQVSDRSEITALAEGTGAAGDILVDQAAAFSLTSGSTITAETRGAGQGGQITIRDVGSALLSGGSSITTRSSAKGGGDAGDIVIASLGTLEATGSAITTTAADAGGGRVSIQAPGLVYLLDSRLETSVQGALDVEGQDAGDVSIPLRGDEVAGLASATPEFVVVNRSVIRTNANATDAGDITIAGSHTLISSDSVLDANSETGVSGEIRIEGPVADLVDQVAPLPSSFVDPSDRLLPPCIARTERTGSFVVQNRAALPPPPDAPLSPAPGSGWGGSASPESSSGACQVIQESP